MTNEEYVSWWSSYRNTQNLSIELKEMEDHFINQGLIRYSSNYWNWLNHQNISQITLYGYENFKQTVARNYFTWVVQPDHPYARSIQKLAPKLTVHLPQQEILKVHALFTPEQSWVFNKLTAHFLNYILKIGKAPTLKNWKSR